MHQESRRPQVASFLTVTLLAALAAAVALDAQGRAGGRSGAQDAAAASGAPSLQPLVAGRADDSDFRLVTARFEQDLAQIRARYDVPLSPVRIDRERRFLTAWLAQIGAFDAGTLNAAGRAEHARLRTLVQAELAALVAQERQVDEMRPLLPFVRPLQALQEARRDRLDVDAERAAQTLEDARKAVLRLTAAIENARRPDGPPEFRSITAPVASRSVEYLTTGLRQPLQSWYTYSYGFDPLFTWWVRVPYAGLNEALDAYAAAIRREWPEAQAAEAATGSAGPTPAPQSAAPGAIGQRVPREERRGTAAPGARAARDTSWADEVPGLQSLVDFARGESELRTVVPAYDAGRAAMRRGVEALAAAQRAETQLRWYRSWLGALAALDFDPLSIEGKIDYILLRNRIEFEIALAEDGRDLAAGGQGPVGADALRAHLAREMIPYSPEEILAISEREFEWMDRARLDATRRMGYGDDWRAAIEAVKRTAAPPGRKPAIVRDLAYQSEAFLEAHDLITVPPLLREVWRMNMRSAQQQVGGAFFSGGITIGISYPTDEMTHERKLMSQRGNNEHFNRATVHHELIPGHGLQAFMTSRFNSHRAPFGGPFWGEGWALYFEFVLWDLGFPRGPEDELGMLFWRMHRAARIHFIINYHLGRMTADEGVDYLVDRLGFERANAEAEVGWGTRAEPLYQAAYMLGGLQFYALRKELVDSGRLSQRAFHDAIITGGRMPVEAVRLRLGGEGLTRDYRTTWRFYGDPLTPREQLPVTDRGAASDEPRPRVQSLSSVVRHPC